VRNTIIVTTLKEPNYASHDVVTSFSQLSSVEFFQKVLGPFFAVSYHPFYEF
jgi:hypothetical protein